ncbi:CLUMA_CG005059, isoform A [Clunio marinus]|uniref:CLUMA_CG005059, isoform A n=1 Tax=Clunio marinus TaxID=568069 RepID=A0A1J1HV16_9DIPT|nr:CLUMA_CG005059, isoform A [Clunio marinus]
MEDYNKQKINNSNRYLFLVLVAHAYDLYVFDIRKQPWIPLSNTNYKIAKSENIITTARELDIETNSYTYHIRVFHLDPKIWLSNININVQSNVLITINRALAYISTSADFY